MPGAFMSGRQTVPRKERAGKWPARLMRRLAQEETLHQCSFSTWDRLQARIAFLSASIASGRGKLRRQASPTRRDGTGRAKGRNGIRSLLQLALTDVDGSTVTPTPPATIWRRVSSEPPSTVRASELRSRERIVWQNSSTWSRKQWP